MSTKEITLFHNTVSKLFKYDFAVIQKVFVSKNALDPPPYQNLLFESGKVKLDSNDPV